MVRRWTTLYAVIPSIVTVCLAIALLAAGLVPENGKDSYWMSLNASQVGREIVRVAPVSDIANNSDGFFHAILGSLVDNITVAIDDGAGDLQGKIADNLVKALGVKDVYNFYLSKACEGSYDNPDDPDSGVTIIRCVDYEDRQQGLRNVSDSIPGYFIVGNTNISVPLVAAMSSTIDSALSLATQGAHAMLVLLIIGIASVGISLLGTLAVAVRGFRCPVVWINMCFANIGAAVLFVFAATATGVVVGGSDAVEGFGAAWGVRATRGSAFLAMAWVAAFLSLVGSGYWFAVWFVELRRTAFVRVARSEEEIGNWRGIFGEVGRNVRIQGEKLEEGGDGSRRKSP